MGATGPALNPVECPGCGSNHVFTNAGFAIVVTAMGSGLLHQVTGDGIKSLCYMQAFEHKDIVARYDSKPQGRRFYYDRP